MSAVCPSCGCDLQEAGAATGGPAVCQRCAQGAGPYRSPVILRPREEAVAEEDPAPRTLRWTEGRDGNHFRFGLSQRRVESLPLFFLAVGLWEIYSALEQLAPLLLCLLTVYMGLCLVVNRACIQLDPFRFTVTRESLPGAALLLGTFSLGPPRSATTEQGLREGCIFCEPSLNILRFVATQERPTGRDGGTIGTLLCWTVALITKDGHRTTLDLRLLRESHAHYVASRLNKAIDLLRG